jgi:hypothetical protein
VALKDWSIVLSQKNSGLGNISENQGKAGLKQSNLYPQINLTLNLYSRFFVACKGL